MNPWVALGLVLAWVASLAAVGTWQNKAGHTAERVAWQAREATELRTANAEILRLEEAARAAEGRKAAELDQLAKNYEGKLADAKRQKELDIRRARDGSIGLRIPSPCKGTDQGGTAKAAPGTGLGDGGATAELPREIAADLFSLADDADEVVQQLTACQAVVRADRAADPSQPAH